MVLDREATDLLRDTQWSNSILSEKPSSQFILPKSIRTTGDGDWHCWDVSPGEGRVDEPSGQLRRRVGNSSERSVSFTCLLLQLSCTAWADRLSGILGAYRQGTIPKSENRSHMSCVGARGTSCYTTPIKSKCILCTRTSGSRKV